MEYWIVVNDERVGPLTLEELKAYELTPDTPVWHVGLADWIPAGQVSELVDMLKTEEVENIEEGAIAEDTAEIEPTIEPEVVVIEKEEEKKPMRPCPPTYLVWAILTVILCCAPLGIPAVIYSSQVKTKYNNGDYYGARKASERAALWVILAFVIGLMYQPFSGLFSVLWSSLQGAM